MMSVVRWEISATQALPPDWRLWRLTHKQPAEHEGHKVDAQPPDKQERLGEYLYMRH